MRLRGIGDDARIRSINVNNQKEGIGSNRYKKSHRDLQPSFVRSYKAANVLGEIQLVEVTPGVIQNKARVSAHGNHRDNQTLPFRHQQVVGSNGKANLRLRHSDFCERAINVNFVEEWMP